jgi:hypothetical protein
MSSSLQAYAHKVCEQMYTSFEAGGDHGRALLADDSATLATSVDVSFMFNCAYMVFFMQLGFAAVCHSWQVIMRDVDVTLRRCCRPACATTD